MMEGTGDNKQLQVIGAGFGRTGTYSLKHALETLGFGPCHHMSEVLGQPERANFWLAAANGESVDWSKGLAGYRATVDWPAAAFYAQLAERYPDARVILTVRDPERWYESCLASIYSPVARAAKAEAAPNDAPDVRMIVTLIWQRTFGGRFTDREHAINVYQRHNHEVRECIPADRLLVYEVRQGWEPLLEFLDVPPPGMPFPRINTSEEWKDRHPFLERDRPLPG